MLLNLLKPNTEFLWNGKEQCGTSDSVLKAFDFLFAFKTSGSQIQVLNSFDPIYVDILKQTISDYYLKYV